jgi:hypothetical protein
VWNYAQALPHLFPSLERTLRETEFGPSQNVAGHQTFRSALPIRPLEADFHAAADGQLGGIMKVYRDWRISGDTEWLRRLWPKVRQSLDYCIKTWDPGHKGIVEEPHHNTYDIEFWGPDGMCTSFYLGALKAAAAMGEALGEPVPLYSELLAKGTAFTEQQLFDGEYFIQKIQWTGLKAENPLENKSMVGSYSPEAVEVFKKEGPKYQYGTGCLSDGVLGSWLALVCGVGEVLDQKKVASHLKAVHKHNLKYDLSDYANPQRPAYALGEEAGLLLCSWPKGGELSLPFVYSNEVWTRSRPISCGWEWSKRAWTSCGRAATATTAACVILTTSTSAATGTPAPCPPTRCSTACRARGTMPCKRRCTWTRESRAISSASSRPRPATEQLA